MDKALTKKRHQNGTAYKNLTKAIRQEKIDIDLLCIYVDMTPVQFKSKRYCERHLSAEEAFRITMFINNNRLFQKEPYTMRWLFTKVPTWTKK